MFGFPRFSPDFQKAKPNFLTFRRGDFFAAGVSSVSIAGIFPTPLANPGFFSYLYISITGIFFLRDLKNGLIHLQTDTGHHLISLYRFSYRKNVHMDIARCPFSY